MKTSIDALHTLTLRIITTLFSLAVGIATARLLGPEGRGIFALATLIASVYMLLLSNVSGAITYCISRMKHPPSLVMANALALLVIFALFNWLVALTLFKWYWGTDWWFLFFVAVGTPFTILVSYVSGSLLGLDNVRRVNYVTSTLTILTGSLIVAFLVVFGRTASSALWGWLVGQAITGIWVVLRTRSIFMPLSWRKLDRSLIMFLLGFGIQIGFVNLVGLLNYRADVFMVEYYLGFKQVGIYSVAISVAETLWFISGAISLAIYGRLGQEEANSAADLTAKAVRHTLVIILPVVILLFLSSDFLIPLLYGAEFQPASRALRILLPGIAFFGLASIFSAYFTNHMGKPKISLCIALLSLCINLIVSVIAIPRIGIVGGAWATTISYSIAICFSLAIFMRVAKVSILKLLPGYKEIQSYFEFAKMMGGRLGKYFIRPSR